MNRSDGVHSRRLGGRLATADRGRPWRLLLAVTFLGLASVSQTARATLSERLMVWARPGVSELDLGRSLAPYQMVRHHMGMEGWHLLTLPAGVSAVDMHRRLSAHPMLQQVEPDRMHGLSQQAFNDPFAGSLWHLAKVSTQTAWTMAVGMGRGVTVAVLDTGVQADHPDLSGVVTVGWNVVDRNANTQDNHGHGTSVAGLIAAKINNGQGVVGLSPGVRILPMRVSLADGNARTSDIALGMRDAAERGARIVNISFEGVMGNGVIRAAAQDLSRKGVLVVASSGNRGEQEVHTPQAGLVVVGALDEADRRPAWSTYGSHLTVAAPGEGLWTTGLGGGYRVVWGTSFSAPLVSAVAALMWEAAPDAQPQQIEQWLKESAVDLGAPGPDSQFGFGRLNAEAAVRAARRWQTTRTAPSAEAGLSPQTVPPVPISVRPPAVTVPAPVPVQAPVPVPVPVNAPTPAATGTAPTTAQPVPASPSNRPITGWNQLRRSGFDRSRQ